MQREREGLEDKQRDKSRGGEDWTAQGNRS